METRRCVVLMQKLGYEDGRKTRLLQSTYTSNQKSIYDLCQGLEHYGTSLIHETSVFVVVNTESQVPKVELQSVTFFGGKNVFQSFAMRKKEEIFVSLAIFSHDNIIKIWNLELGQSNTIFHSF